MPTTSERIADLQRRLEWLRREDRAATVFGSTQHQYRAEPALTGAELEAFEAAHGVALPASYRAYLDAIGNGGVGPYYGLSPLAPLVLDQLPQQHVVVSDGDGNVLGEAATGPRPLPDVPSTLARPFALTGEWSPGSPLPVEPGTSPYDGCVHLAEQGCGYFDFLVVHGDAAGQVWSDYTAGDGPITRTHDDFLDWYEEWLDRAQLEWLERNAIDMARYAPPHYPGIDECVALLDRALESAPAWADGWRTRGYVALNRQEWEDAGAAFATAAEHGQQEATARLHLDRARLAGFRGAWSDVLTEADAGLAESDLWASTETELRQEKVRACDQLGDTEGALAALGELAEDTYFHFDNHYELARRRLVRDEPARAWAVLDQAVTDNVGPDRHNQPTTRDAVYGGFAAWLDHIGATELAARVRAEA